MSDRQRQPADNTLQGRRRRLEEQLSKVNSQLVQRERIAEEREARRKAKADAQAEAAKQIPEAEADLKRCAFVEQAAQQALTDATIDRIEARKALNALKVAAGQPVRPRRKVAQDEASRNSGAAGKEAGDEQ